MFNCIIVHDIANNCTSTCVPQYCVNIYKLNSFRVQEKSMSFADLLCFQSWFYFNQIFCRGLTSQMKEYDIYGCDEYDQLYTHLNIWYIFRIWLDFYHQVLVIELQSFKYVKCSEIHLKCSAGYSQCSLFP